MSIDMDMSWEYGGRGVGSRNTTPTENTTIMTRKRDPKSAKRRRRMTIRKKISHLRLDPSATAGQETKGVAKTYSLGLCGRDAVAGLKEMEQRKGDRKRTQRRRIDRNRCQGGRTYRLLRRMKRRTKTHQEHGHVRYPGVHRFEDRCEDVDTCAHVHANRAWTANRCISIRIGHAQACRHGCGYV